MRYNDDISVPKGEQIFVMFCWDYSDVELTWMVDKDFRNYFPEGLSWEESMEYSHYYASRSSRVGMMDRRARFYVDPDHLCSVCNYIKLKFPQDVVFHRVVSDRNITAWLSYQWYATHDDTIAYFHGFYPDSTFTFPRTEFNSEIILDGFEPYNVGREFQALFYEYKTAGNVSGCLELLRTWHEFVDMLLSEYVKPIL